MFDPPQLESEEMSRITALCRRAYSVEGGVGDMPGLMEEVSVDYLRTMNKIVLEAQTKQVSDKTQYPIWFGWVCCCRLIGTHARRDSEKRLIREFSSCQFKHLQTGRTL